MIKTYADECLERAEKFPFGSSNYGHDTIAAAHAAEDELDYAYSVIVPELARRLKKSCDVLKQVGHEFSKLSGYDCASYDCLTLADELEAPLGEK